MLEICRRYRSRGARGFCAFVGYITVFYLCFSHPPPHTMLVLQCCYLVVLRTNSLSNIIGRSFTTLIRELELVYLV